MTNNIYLYNSFFRIKQIKRFFGAVGIFYSFSILLFFIIGWFVLFKLTALHIFSPIICLSILLYLCQSKRKDNLFTNLYIKKSYLLYICEYTLLSVPFILILLLYGNYIYILLCFVLILLTPLVFNYKFNYPKITIPIFIKGSFEYQIGIRKSYLFFLLSYIISFLGIYNGNLKVLLVFFVISALIYISSISVYDDKYYLKSYISANHFLFHKVKSCLFNFSILFIPFIVMAISEIHIIINIYILVIFSVLSYIFLKYIYLNQLTIVTIYFIVGIVPINIITIMYPYIIIPYIGLIIYLSCIVRNKFNKDIL